MYYIVSGLPRSGTSMMMHLHGVMGIEPYYSLKREKKLVTGHPKANPYYYEDIDILRGVIKNPSRLDNKCIKIFANGFQKLDRDVFRRDNTKIIYMYRFINMVGLVTNRRGLKPSQKHFFKLGELQANFLTFRGFKQIDLLVEMLYDYNILVVEYDRLMQEPSTELNRIKNYLEIDFDIEDIASHIDINRYHRKKPTTKELNDYERHLRQAILKGMENRSQNKPSQ